MSPEENQETDLGAPPERDEADSLMAPQVTAVVVTHDPGDWFDQTLAAIAAQDYPALDVVVVDAASLLPVEDRVHRLIPDARVVRLEENPGFGRAINTVLPSLGDPAFLVLAHDDAAPDPTAVRALVEEAFRSNAGVVGPKIVRWDDPQRLLSAGEGIDKVGFPVPIVERHELDQEQHDAVRDVFVIPDSFTLVRTDLLRTLDGFDPAMSFFGDDLDLCWRAHVVGARVMVAPTARVRHLEGLGHRQITDVRRRLQFRHRMRVMLTAYRLPTLLIVLPQLLVVHLVEALFALITGRPGQARDVMSAWTWNIRNLGSLRKRRAHLNQQRRVSDSEIRSMQVRGSARVAAFVRGQLASSDQAFGSATGLGKRVIESVAGPGRREALVGWIAVALILLIGSRHLLTRPIPAVGELIPFPESISAMISDWFSSWQPSGLGREGFTPPASLLVAIGGTVLLGGMGLLRTILILGMLPLGLLGVWRLLAPLASARASVAGLLAYTAIPLGYDSLATGSWRGLVAYGFTPWVVARVLRASGAAPFGAAGEEAGPRFDIPPLWRQALALGILVALAAVIDPLFIVLPLLVWLFLLPGSVIIGAFDGLGRMLAVGLGAGLVAGAFHGPWLFDLLSDPSWDTFTLSRGSDAIAGMGITHVLRFDTGPIGSSALSAAVLIAAGFVMLVGRDWRLAGGARGWSLAVCSWALVWTAAMGWLPFGLPSIEMILAPAAVGLALCIGLGVSAFEIDVRRSTFGWRQFFSIVAGLALLIGLMPVMAASVGGRWLLPRSSHHQSLAFLDDEVEHQDFRVLWFGDPEVMPLGTWPIDGLTSYATTTSGTPTLSDMSPGSPEKASAPLRGSIDLALGRQTNRLGRLLAPMGVRYIVVVDQGAPMPFGGIRRPSPPALTQALSEQLDLVQLDVNPVVHVFQNEAWSPVTAAHPEGTLPAENVRAVPEGARQAAGIEFAATAQAVPATGSTSFEGAVPQNSEVLLGSTPASGWQVEIDGRSVPTRRAFGWATVADAADGGVVSVSWQTSLLHRLVLVGQLLLVVLAAAVMYRTRAERREAARRRRSLLLIDHRDEL